MAAAGGLLTVSMIALSALAVAAAADPPVANCDQPPFVDVDDQHGGGGVRCIVRCSAVAKASSVLLGILIGILAAEAMRRVTEFVLPVDNADMDRISAVFQDVAVGKLPPPEPKIIEVKVA